MRIVRAAAMPEGRWRNGMGVSWDIAAEPPEAGADDFGWRFAVAQIDGDVPFSHYANVDRVFTLIAGKGLVLTVAGLGELDVSRVLEPVRFPGDAETFCRVKDGSCRALNLFLGRGRWTAEVAVEPGETMVDHAGPVLLFAPEGPVMCNGQRLETGDAAVARGALVIDSGPARHYRALLTASA